MRRLRWMHVPSAGTSDAWEGVEWRGVACFVGTRILLVVRAYKHCTGFFDRASDTSRKFIPSPSENRVALVIWVIAALFASESSMKRHLPIIFIEHVRTSSSIHKSCPCMGPDEQDSSACAPSYPAAAKSQVYPIVQVTLVSLPYRIRGQG